jgi:hypothetical protein
VTVRIRLPQHKILRVITRYDAQVPIILPTISELEKDPGFVMRGGKLFPRIPVQRLASYKSDSPIDKLPLHEKDAKTAD